MNKNSTYNCGENDDADQLLCMLEANSVLSEKFCEKIQRIVLVIVSNLEGNEEWIESSINKLKEEMDWLNIFSKEFKGSLIGQLRLSLFRQETINKK